ncbi:MAG: family 78 glycoside hydrolase catalytic domain [Verrucomicrobiota bacterium]
MKQIITLTALLLVPLAVSAQGGIVPLHLRCECLDNPLGIGTAQPQFGWQLDSAQRGARQTVYQVVVMDVGENTVWDSGKVESPAQNGIVFGGAQLAGKTACRWKVKVWDGAGRESAWSEAATFETGIVNPQRDWRGVWVGGPPSRKDEAGHYATNQFNLIRRRFELPVEKKIVKGRAYVAAQHYALSFFNFSVNGQKPADVFPLRRGIYTFDVTALLRPGENVLGAIFGDTGNPRNNPKNSSQNRLLCDVDVWFADGSHLIFGTDERCRGFQGGPVLSGDMFDGETFDARQAVAWDQPGFDDSHWTAGTVAQATAKPDRVVLNFVRVAETFAPLKMTTPKSGVWIFDAGTQISGWAQMRVNGPAGTRITLRFAERLNADGTLDISTITKGLPAKQTDLLILKDGEQLWEPTLTYHGFRYLEITGWPGAPTLSDIRLRRAAADVLRDRAQFTCSNEMLNRFHRGFADTELANLMFDLTDCNQRAERAPWSADGMCVAEAAMTFFDAAQFFREKWLELCLHRAGPHGEAGNLVYETGGFALLWQAQCALVSWDYWQAYGDKAYLAACYERVKKFADCCVSWFDQLDEVVFDPKKKEIVSHQSKQDWLIDAETPWRDPAGKPCENPLKYWGDWLRPDRQWDKRASFLTSAFYFRCLDIAARMADALGKQEEAARHRAIADKIRNAINARWLKDNRFYCDNDQTPNALALAFGIAPDEARAAVADSLAADIAARTNHLATGCLGTLALMPALAENNRNTVAFALATQRSFPSWGYMLDKGPGTFWEHWNDEGMSKCHPFMGGSVAVWLYRHVAGIKPVKPGYEAIEFRPGLFGDLTFANATIPTVRGPVVSEWRCDGGKFRWSISVPANATATVFIPAADAAAVTESGKPAVQSEGVKFLRTENHTAVYAVGSGTYQFQSTLPESVK